MSQVHYEGVDLGDGEVIEEANEERCNYLGVLEMDDISQEKVKEKVQKEYYKRVKAVLKSKLKCGNAVNAINIWAVATVWYGTGIINWNKRELVKIDQQMKNLLNIYIYFNWDSLHARQNSHYEAWGYKKGRMKKRLQDTENLFRKNLQLKDVC